MRAKDNQLLGKSTTIFFPLSHRLLFILLFHVNNTLSLCDSLFLKNNISLISLECPLCVQHEIPREYNLLGNCMYFWRYNFGGFDCMYYNKYPSITL